MNIKEVKSLIKSSNKIIFAAGYSLYTDKKIPEDYKNWEDILNYQKSDLNFSVTNKFISKLLKNKDYFFITSSWLSKIDKILQSDRICRLGGDSSKLQCYNACTDKLWDINEFLGNTIHPRCTFCNSLLVMNIRIDAFFVNDIYEEEENNFHKWIHKNYNEQILIIEWEVNDSEKRLIKDPLENIASALPNVTILRVNSLNKEVPQIIKRRYGYKVSPEKFISRI